MPGPGAYWIGEEEKAQVLEVMESGHVSRYGDLDDPKYKQKVLTFEKEFAAFCGARSNIRHPGTNPSTAAIHAIPHPATSPTNPADPASRWVG